MARVVGVVWDASITCVN